MLQYFFRCDCRLATSCVSADTVEWSFWIALRADTQQMSHTQPRVVISVFKQSCNLGGTGRHLTWYTALHMMSQNISSPLLDIITHIKPIWNIFGHLALLFVAGSPMKVRVWIRSRRPINYMLRLKRGEQNHKFTEQTKEYSFQNFLNGAL